MNTIEKRTPAGILVDIRIQYIDLESLLRLITTLPHTAVVTVTKCWPAPNNEAARFQIGKQEFIIETSFADMFIAPSGAASSEASEAFETLAEHLRIAKEKYRESLS